MKKQIFSIIFLTFSLSVLFAQTDDELFGGDDDFFTDDGIEVVEEVSAKSDLSKGTLFETGSIKIGGNFSTSLTTMTTLYSDNSDNSGASGVQIASGVTSTAGASTSSATSANAESSATPSFKDNLYNTKLTPTASAYILVDARPSQTLRMYTKFGIAYPYTVSATTRLGDYTTYGPTSATTSITDWFTLKELFTDFSIPDRAFFRFGLHTVTWGCGYFFSPVSDLINTSSINPEDTDAQVDGSLNLRTQITFPGSQNCLWFYVIPSTDFINQASAESYLRDTALAGKYELVLGGWEFGLGGFWKYQNAPKAMVTASGSLKNISIFGEFVYRYGADSEWTASSDWADKTNIIQATVGLSRYWKTPLITFAAQYYYDSNDKDMAHQYFTYGHNLAAILNFGRIFGKTDFTANLFAMVNFGKEEMPALLKSYLSSYGFSSYLNSMTLSAMFNYSPISELKLGLGPYLTWESLENKPVVSLKLTATLGGGKF